MVAIIKHDHMKQLTILNINNNAQHNHYIQWQDKTPKTTLEPLPTQTHTVPPVTVHVITCVIVTICLTAISPYKLLTTYICSESQLSVMGFFLTVSCHIWGTQVIQQSLAVNENADFHTKLNFLFSSDIFLFWTLIMITVEGVPKTARN